MRCFAEVEREFGAAGTSEITVGHIRATLVSRSRDEAAAAFRRVAYTRRMPGIF
jgi:hypothetical protein